MKIISGLFDNMVMQRDANNFSMQKICGEATPNKTVFVILPNGEKEILGESSSDGKFCGILRSLKAGGAYQITVSDGVTEITFSNLMVGDVWMLAGQSNMQGIGNMDQALPSSDEVRAFYLDNQWRVAQDPLHNMEKACAEIHWTINGGHHAFDNAPEVPIKGVGSGVAFGQAMAKKTGVPQGLIASAHGGTNMKLWNPELKEQGENSLYGAMYDRFIMNGSKIAGVLWYQGCSDSSPDENVELYTQRTLELFRAMRRDFGDEKLPIVLAQLARTATAYDFALDNRWSKIREKQRLIGNLIGNCIMVSTVDLELDDSIHLSGNAQAILGRRMADAACFIRGIENENPPLEIGKIEYVENKKYHEYLTIIQVKNVVGSLHSGGSLAATFSLHEAGSDNKISVPPFKCKLEGDKIILTSSSTLGCKVAYAFGCNAIGNVYDNLNRPLPAFGPLFSHDVYRSTPLLAEVEVSEAVMGEDNFEALYVDENKLASLQFSKVKSPKTYLEFERVLEQGDYVRFVKWRCLCKKAVNCRILFGSDSDFRLFCDGKELLSQKNVANPVIPDEFMKDISLEAGEHEFTMGLSGKAGNAWGFCCRFVDVNDILDVENEGNQSDNLPIFI
ncbi:MAG: hypothetical protein IJW31_00830 [Lentisphaeria bacterium]|nr:hypothetical protein [Lentisphaeria bacterium]